MLINIPWYKKKVFAMLRAGCLPLEVETGRRHRPQPVPLQDRICKMCHSNEVEDERHFMLKCNLYVDLRDILFDHCRNNLQTFNDQDDVGKFAYMMQTGDLQILNSIFKMYNRRSLYLM